MWLLNNEKLHLELDYMHNVTINLNSNFKLKTLHPVQLSIQLILAS